jgi:hypothetical protein
VSRSGSGSHDPAGFVTVSDLLSHASVRERSSRLAAACAAVNRTFEVGWASGEPRETGPSWADWRVAVESLRIAEQLTYQNPLWRRLKAALATGDATAREAALVYLEADPWCFRSGYEKAELMKSLSRLDLDNDDRDRVRRIVLHVVQQPPRREFRHLVGLAASIHDAELDRRLDTLAENAPPEVCRQVALLRERMAQRLRSGPAQSRRSADGS